MEYLMYEQIERYLAGKMVADEKAAFEALLLTDNRLAEQVQEHRTLLRSMQQYGQRQELRSKLNSIHTQMQTEQNAKVIPMWNAFWKRHARRAAAGRAR